MARGNLEEFCRCQYFLLTNRTEYKAYQQHYREGESKKDFEGTIAFYNFNKNYIDIGILSGYAFSKIHRQGYNSNFAALAAVQKRFRKVDIIL